MALRLVTMGTGGFALPTFLSLYDSPHQVVALFTQPDRTGRGHHQHPQPMKEAALERGTPVFQPENVNAVPDVLRALAPDLCVVAAYGQILSAAVLAAPRLGAINLHASLLPRYRGAAPIQHAILHGETETGVTIFRIEPKLDAGPILGVVHLPILPKETAGELEERLAEAAVPLTRRVLDELEAGTMAGVPQDPAQATRAPRLRKEDGAIDWSRSPREIERHVRAMQPWPKAFTFLEQPGKPPLRLILLDVEPVDAESAAPPGTVLETERAHLVVQTGGGALGILRLQPEGKRAMGAPEFIRGHAPRPGDRLARCHEEGSGAGP